MTNAYLEGTYSEVYPDIAEDTDGMKRLFKQFSFPGGIPSHVAPEPPGSILMLLIANTPAYLLQSRRRGLQSAL